VEVKPRSVIAMSTRLGDHLMPAIAESRSAYAAREHILDRLLA
ncbi:TetR/AcrR family transcriptional regulator, partial [Burkholderia multivorans]